ncbi:unnamed protein product [Lampetra fluviatilis]
MTAVVTAVFTATFKERRFICNCAKHHQVRLTLALRRGVAQHQTGVGGDFRYEAMKWCVQLVPDAPLAFPAHGSVRPPCATRHGGG